MTFNIKLPSALTVFGLAIFTTSSAHAYDRATIKNNTDYTISGEVDYGNSFFCSNDDFSVAPQSSWTAPDSRGACLITKISGKVSGSAKHGESTSISNYISSGTTYSQFQINAYDGKYRIFSDSEYASVSKGKGQGPGFKFVNKTVWPVAYSLEQTGCLHHGILSASKNGKHGVDIVDTGSVWFTVRVNIQPDGKPPKEGFQKCGAMAVENLGLGVSNSFLAWGRGLIMVGKGLHDSAVEDSIKNSFVLSEAAMSKDVAKDWAKYLVDAGSARIKGQYAGYTWPFRCDAMPEYHISGGPEIINSGGKLYFSQGEDFKVEKVNDCGDDMMTLSPKSATASASVSYENLRAKLTEVKATKRKVNLPQSGLVTDGAYYWFLNGDGSRNWIKSKPSCASTATKVSKEDIDTVHKRHDGDGAAGYGLDSDSHSRICASSKTATAPKIITDGAYYWFINADGTRNWLSSVPERCKGKAEIIKGDPNDYPKRAKGVSDNGYKLEGRDITLVCDLSLLLSP